MTPTKEQWERGQQILAGCSADDTHLLMDDDEFASSLAFEEDWLALACVLLTSPVKIERETGKALVREWKRAGVSRVKLDAID